MIDLLLFSFHHVSMGTRNYFKTSNSSRMFVMDVFVFCQTFFKYKARNRQLIADEKKKQNYLIENKMPNLLKSVDQMKSVSREAQESQDSGANVSHISVH